ncbi:hypothetical protein ACQP0C_18185 [Nocardia sp. CA-129566]|uniref:hypothetical protein n=1 Tax=Nocardia sp. CA-129566 TaxID=3239976 RepID=UPI003D99E9C9
MPRRNTHAAPSAIAGEGTADGRFAAGQIPSNAAHISDFILEIVANCGHTSTLEQPEAITELLVAFLTSLDRGHPAPHLTRPSPPVT